jgi:hypothetical protein
VYGGVLGSVIAGIPAFGPVVSWLLRGIRSRTRSFYRRDAPKAGPFELANGLLDFPGRGRRTLRGSGYRNHARGGEKSTPGSRCALSYRGPARGQPILSGADQGIRTGSAKSIVMADCHEQFLLADWVVLCWDLRPRLFWDFAASGAGRRRPGRHRYRMGAPQAARRRKTRRAQNRPAAGHIPPGIPSLDDATDSRPSRAMFCVPKGSTRRFSKPPPSRTVVMHQICVRSIVALRRIVYKIYKQYPCLAGQTLLRALATLVAASLRRHGRGARS